jgi:dihydroorotate dehydrogenase electron transfer subunit
LPGVHLLEIRAPQLARTLPGQYCLLRCCDSVASDPLLRRPFFVVHVEPGAHLCRFLVYQRGRGSSWLARQQPGMTIDMLGPLGHGWNIRPEASNLLLIGEGPLLASLLLLVNLALERELAVTLIHLVEHATEAYPSALLPPELEYQVLAGERATEALRAEINAYSAWADLICCNVQENTLNILARGSTRWREKHFVQSIPQRSLMCATATCLACQLETRHGPRLLCREGPVFALRDLLGDW